MGYDDRQAGASDVLASFVLGFLAGAGMALLLTPRPGREIREVLGERLGEAGERLEALGERMKEAAERGRDIGDKVAEKGREIAKGASRVVEKGREILDDV